ncbi:hypothetical protein KBC79_01475 [Candidatus Woesebacteria bacterium]|nr:hypothetical protein [Candidatus Woesebacteria bacterium]
MTKTVKEIRDALIKSAWDVNATRPGSGKLLVVYPNELLLELFGEDITKENWINDNATEFRN